MQLRFSSLCPKQLTQFGAEMHRQILDSTEHYARALTHFDLAETM
jgi:hypothetical protein